MLEFFTWRLNDIHKMTLGKIAFQLKKPHDFSWLEPLGEVFSVFAEQDSGNICFGIEKDGMKRFVKYAGANTVNYIGNTEDAIDRLKRSIPIYNTLKHKHLVNLEDHFEVDNGYAFVFAWFDGECLHPHWSFPPPQKYTNPKSPFFRFKQLPAKQRLASLKCIYEFHVFVEVMDYVPIDFYDGSILYDFQNQVLKICDIDFYQKKPFYNTMGRLWGSNRFMAPEEFQLSAEIDARTTVFTMGATAFCLLGGELDRSYLKWDVGEELYAIAKRATESEKRNRYSTVKEFYDEWNSASKKYLK